jgi:hypothetical protein
MLFLMFTFSKLLHPENGLLSLKGLWQRLYLFDYYLYLVVIAVTMVYSYFGNMREEVPG